MDRREFIGRAFHRSPTWYEGYWAHAAGWPLYDGHTEQYRQGWLYRDRVMRASDGPT
jgi:hypothetical protein